MNISPCAQFSNGTDGNLFLLFERVLPYLVQGLLFGGISPYLMHVTDDTSHEYRHGNVIINFFYLLVIPDERL